MAAVNRGVVLLYEDLFDGWVDWMTDARLTTLGVHKIALPGDDSVGRLLRELDAPHGRDIIERLEKRGITVEYELHTLEWLLPRRLFATEPELFRADDSGRRTNDHNLCPSNRRALELTAGNAYALASKLRQASHNYYFWLDDVSGGICNCEKCGAAGYSGADQNMLIVNAIAEGLRAYDPEARAAYLAYADALQMPRVRPADNVFLEFAPMTRSHFKPIDTPGEAENARYVKLLDELLTIFPPEESQVLEYWLDDAMYSGYKMPPARVPFDAATAQADTAFYTSRGIKTVKTFASYLGKEYSELYGIPPIKEYGDILYRYLR